MENSRRSAMDRPRDPSLLKRPRLAPQEQAASPVPSAAAAVAPRDRSFPLQRSSAAGQQALASRSQRSAAAREERDEPPPKNGSYHELYAEYKTALAELTFNSKPIITNLTIIAGENVQAAKGIAAIICANILEILAVNGTDEQCPNMKLPRYLGLSDILRSSKPNYLSRMIKELTGQQQFVETLIVSMCGQWDTMAVMVVPIDQKLPSLYLLDSIVKNIGRDYIRYFAARLPDVFCKAYKQVDPSIHPSMRHLFGTWKGVFPSAPLQLIEKELGFSSIVNGSSGSASSKLDSQAQRPPHSIHVNPKYLESRQTLQQPTRAKELGNEDALVSYFDEKEKPERTAGLGSARQWSNNPSKGEVIKNHVQENKGFINVRDHEFSSDVTQDSDIAIGRTSDGNKERDERNRPLYVGGFGSSDALNRRNGFDVNHSYDVYRASGSARINNQLNSSDFNDSDRNRIGSSKSWKNSEEEEYVWDDMNSKPPNYGNSSLIKGGWKDDDTDKSLGPQRGKSYPLEMKQSEISLNRDTFHRSVRSVKEDGLPPFKVPEEHLMQLHPKHDSDSRTSTNVDSLIPRQTTSENRRSSLWATHETPSPSIGLKHDSPRLGQAEGKPFSFGANISTVSSSTISFPGQPSHASNPSSRPYANMLGSDETFGQRLHTIQLPSPSAHSPPNIASAHLRSDSFSQIKLAHLPGQLNQIRHAPATVDGLSFPAKSHDQSFPNASDSIPSLSEPSRNLKPLPGSASSALFGQSRENQSSAQHQPGQILRQIGTQSQASLQTEKLLPLSQGFQAQEIAGDSGTSSSNDNSLEPSVHPNTSNLLAAIMKSGVISNNPLSNFQRSAVLPPLPSVLPPIPVLASAVPSAVPSLLPPASHNNSPDTNLPPGIDVLPPLPPGPPPVSSVLTKSSSNLSTVESTANPLSNLLSSLVAKGLISSPATEKSSAGPRTESSDAPKQVSPNFATSDNIASSAKESPLQTIGLETGVPSHTASAECKELLGFEFKPETLRTPHPSVISSLFDNLKHECNLCGLRFRHEQQLQGHLNWHASMAPEISSFSRKSRKWFVSMTNWVSGSVELQTGMVEDITFEEIILPEEKSEPMVPADESQTICALCGEPFEDTYSEERDEWMYKGTVYLELPIGQNAAPATGETSPLPIVHAQCISQASNPVDKIKHEHHEVVPAYP